ncbi:MAG TPA: hypothetical protein VF988_00585 [Verrucomicrobiae bacterium]
MSRFMAALCALALLAGSGRCFAQGWLDSLESDLKLSNPSGSISSQMTVLLDLEGYASDVRAPGLIYDDQPFLNPRATFYIDTMLVRHFYSFVQARVDRGFDPGSQDGDARLDEYLLRWTPLDTPALNVQFGKFATVVGNWVQRHDSWENPLITPPLPYSGLTTVKDGNVPRSPWWFLWNRDYAADKDEWLPVVWGPSYATGWSVFGSIGKFDYAFEIKNASLSSRPGEWALNNNMWETPTYSGRLGFRPSPAWNSGISLSVGPYLSTEAKSFLPLRKGLNDYDEIVLDYDLSYAWHHWEFWAEFFFTRFQAPNVGNADVFTYYLEAKYKITPQLFIAARWNQQVFGSVKTRRGNHETWDRNVIQPEVALGYRFNRHWQAKVQYSFSHRESTVQQGEHMFAGQVTLKF